MDYVVYMKMKFCDEKGILVVMKLVMEVSEWLGLWLNFSLIQCILNMLNVYCLMYWVGFEGVQIFVMLVLMWVYWCEGKNIGNFDVLVDIGVVVGMDFGMICCLLVIDEDKVEVVNCEIYVCQCGVSLVLIFIVVDSYVVIGVQFVSLWMQVIDELIGV